MKRQHGLRYSYLQSTTLRRNRSDNYYPIIDEIDCCLMPLLSEKNVIRSYLRGILAQTLKELR